jgi:DNA-binding NarL/FixJ family response regulator
MHSARRYLDPSLVRHLSHAHITLTKHEYQVLKSLRNGLTNKDISAQLCISPVTIRDYVQNLMVKLNAKNANDGGCQRREGRLAFG